MCSRQTPPGNASTVVILSMSAVGASMFPRFLIPEGMKTIGLFTFNSWALGGYIKIFWRDAALWELRPKVAILLGLAAVFLWLARVLARRWETI